MYQQQFNSRLISAITLKKKIIKVYFWPGCVCVLASVWLHTPVTCQSEIVTDTSVTLCHQSGLKPSLATDTARAELDRSNFNQVGFASCHRCDQDATLWLTDSVSVFLFVCVCVCLNVGIFLCVCVLIFDWVLTCVWISQFFFLSNKVLIEPSLRHRFITEDNFHHIIWCQGAADLSRVVDPDKSSPSRELSCFWSPQSFHQLSRNRPCLSFTRLWCTEGC